jgi:hypothetical protein
MQQVSTFNVTLNCTTIKDISCTDVQGRKLLSSIVKQFVFQPDSLFSSDEFFSPERGNVFAVLEAPHLAPVLSMYFGSWSPHQ